MSISKAKRYFEVKKYYGYWRNPGCFGNPEYGRAILANLLEELVLPRYTNPGIGLPRFMNNADLVEKVEFWLEKHRNEEDLTYHPRKFKNPRWLPYSFYWGGLRSCQESPYSSYVSGVYENIRYLKFFKNSYCWFTGYFWTGKVKALLYPSLKKFYCRNTCTTMLRALLSNSDISLSLLFW